MPEASVQPDTEELTKPGGTADIVVGVLSYNSAGTIGTITRDAQNSLAVRFPDKRSVIVHADGGSKDGTQEEALAAAINRDDFVQIAYPIYPAQKISPEHYGAPGKANGMQKIFDVATEMNATACVIVDSTIGVPAHDSLETLVGPIVTDDIDFVTPRYLRHKYDGGILNGVVYPLTRTLYGKRVHQPIGGDYALSNRLVNYLQKQPRPDGDTSSADADVWITVQALCGQFRLMEASLRPRVFALNEPAPGTSAILAQTLGALFAEMNRTAAVWQRIRGSQAVPVFGPGFERLAAPAPVDPSPMLESFRLGYQNLQEIYRLILPPATLMALKRMCLQSPETFCFEDIVWARVVYDFALAWRMRVMDRDHLMGALTPLYLGWVASWVRAVRDDGQEQAEGRIEALCGAYETQKGYLISRWRWPDRFNP
jgi:glucosylglycerate synthase